MMPRQPVWEGSYAIPERKPGDRYTGQCVVCGHDVETWARPLDQRVPAMCDQCQRKNPTRSAAT